MLLWGGRDTSKNIPKGPGSKQRPRSDARLPRVLWQWRPPPPLLPSPTSAPHTPGPGVRAYGGSSISLTVKCLVPQKAKGAKAWRAAGLEAAHAMVAKGWSWGELATLCVPEVPNLLQIRRPHHLPPPPQPCLTSVWQGPVGEGNGRIWELKRGDLPFLIFTGCEHDLVF